MKDPLLDQLKRLKRDFLMHQCREKGCTFDEIAMEFGVSNTTVRNSHLKIKKRLARIERQKAELSGIVGIIGGV